MKNLFLIDGASGTGKTDLLMHEHNFSSKVKIVRKATTRQIREYEKEEPFLDLDFLSEDEFDARNFDYIYTYSTKRYGFNRKDIEEAFDNATNVFVIVRNLQVMTQVMKDFRFINVVPVYIYTDPTTTRERLVKQNRTEEQIDFRHSRLNLAYEDYLHRSTAYKEVLINNSSPADYHRLINAMVAKYREYPDVQDDLVFILMSFNPDNPDLEDYAREMKRAVHDHNPHLRCINLDDLTGSFKISQEAKRNILECRLAIVDLTENKPNVFYELGFAHALNKEVIITMHDEEKILFYPGEYKVVRYHNSSDLYRKLRNELKGQLPKRKLQKRRSSAI